MTLRAIPEPRRLVRPLHDRDDLAPPVGIESGLDFTAELLRLPGVVAITGAGLSTESGIPDYRGPTGRARNATPMTYQEFVGSAHAQRRYWARSYAGWPVMGLSSPNAGHRSVATLQAAGRLTGVITQNVDQLHERVGTDPLVELHGSLGRVVCLACGDVSSRLELQERLFTANAGLDPATLAFGDDAGEVKPDGDIDVMEQAVLRFTTVACLRCDQGPLKPDVVFFGESVPRERVELAMRWVERAPGVLVLGSSLAVMSAYRYVRQAARDGRTVVIVNQGPTRGDAEATLRVDAPLGRFLTALARDGGTRPPG